MLYNKFYTSPWNPQQSVKAITLQSSTQLDPKGEYTLASLEFLPGVRLFQKLHQKCKIRGSQGLIILTAFSAHNMYIPQVFV